MTVSFPLKSSHGWTGLQTKESLPNILLLVTDQFRYDALSPLVTPNLYKLATNERSTRFVNAYSSTPTCTPARAALLTGKSPWNHGMLGYSKAVDCEEYATTLPSVLRDYLGYDTVVVGKNHFGTKPTNKTTSDHTPGKRFVDHGYQFMELYDGLTEIPDDYDEYFHKILPGEDPLSTCHLGWNDWKACPYKFEEYLHPTAWTTRETLGMMDTMLGDNHGLQDPFLLKVSYHRPHSPYDPPKRLWNKHQQRAKNHTNITEPKYTRNIGTKSSSWDRDYFANEMAADAWHGDPGNEASLKSRAAYLANVEFVDEGIGQILQRLKEHGQEDNTFVIWLSDHGDMNGDHNLWRKGYPWEASCHINMVMKLPIQLQETEKPSNRAKSDRSATVSDAIVEIRDVAPTIYDILGILQNVTIVDPMINGKSLLPILQRRSESIRSHLGLEHSIVYDDRIHWNAIVGRVPENITNPNENCTLYKYIFFAGNGNEQLFCLSEDPLEQDNLVDLKKYESIQTYWRTAMAQDFEREGRGTNWVLPNGTLAIRTSGTTIGPHYPCQPSKILQQDTLRETATRAPNKAETNSKEFGDLQLVNKFRLQVHSTHHACVAVAFFVALLSRHFYFGKRRLTTRNKNV